MRRRPGTVALLSLAALLALPGAAAAQQEIIDDYRRDGQVNPCDYTPGELRRGLENLPPDIEQYAPELADQLRRGAVCAAPAPAPQQERPEQAPAALPPGEASPPAAPPPTVPDPPAPRAGEGPLLRGAAPAAADLPLTRADQSDLPAWLLVGAPLAIGAALLAALARPLRAALGAR